MLEKCKNGNILSQNFQFCPILAKVEMRQHKLGNATTSNAVNISLAVFDLFVGADGQKY
jgi:hypothetical protein